MGGVRGLSGLGGRPSGNGPICTDCARCTSAVHMDRPSPPCGRAPAGGARNLVKMTGLTGSGQSDLNRLGVWATPGAGVADAGSRRGGASLAPRADLSDPNDLGWSVLGAASIPGRGGRLRFSRLGIPWPGAGW